jgi:hypothetical protein
VKADRAVSQEPPKVLAPVAYIQMFEVKFRKAHKKNPQSKKKTL